MKRETFLKTVHDSCTPNWAYQVFYNSMFFILVAGDLGDFKNSPVYLQHLCRNFKGNQEVYRVWTTYTPKYHGYRCAHCGEPIPKNVLAVLRLMELDI